MKRWTLAELITRLRHLVNSNEGQSDQDFAGPAGDPDRHFRDAINEAYTDEVIEAAQHASPEKWLHQVITQAWPAAQATLSLPAAVDDKNILSISDTTSGLPGQLLWVGSLSEHAAIWWHDRTTLQWGSTGPAADMTLHITYVAEPQELVNSGDEPFLIPRRFRHLLVWSAGCLMRTIGDEGAPTEWTRRREEIRTQLWKELSLGRPGDTGYAGIRTLNPDYYGPSL